MAARTTGTGRDPAAEATRITRCEKGQAEKAALENAIQREGYPCLARQEKGEGVSDRDKKGEKPKEGPRA